MLRPTSIGTSFLRSRKLIEDLRPLARILVSLMCLGLLPLFVPLQQILEQVERIEVSQVFLAFLLIFFSTFLSSIRFCGMMRSFHIDVTLRAAHKINILSQVVGLFLLQSVGQMIFRSTYGGQYVENPQRLALLTILEKGVALLTMSLVGLAGSYYLTRHLEFSRSDSVPLILTVLAILVALLFSYSIALSGNHRRLVRKALYLLRKSGLEKAAGLSLGMHLLMLLAYVVVAADFLPDVPLPVVFALFSVVMLGAALPISFAGWGIRELSAGFVFTILGYDAAIGVFVAAIVGVVSLLAIGAHAAVANLMAATLLASVSPDESDRVGSRHFEVLVAFFCALAIALFVGFQIRLPTGSGELTVNLADPAAILGAIVFLVFWYREYLHQAVWRINGLALAIACLIALIAYGWLLGDSRDGFSDWATYNRGIGFFVLLSYLFAGSMVTAFFGQSAVRLIARVFLLTTFCILVLYIASVGFLDGEALNRLQWNRHSFNGLIANRNALAFALSLVLAVSLAIKVPIVGRWRPAAIALALFFIVISGSRTGMGVAGTLLILSLALRYTTIKELGYVLVTLALFTVLHQGAVALTGQLGDFGGGASVLKSIEIGQMTVVQHERSEGYEIAFEMWLSHPIFGAGLGTFISHYLDTKGIPHVIHNTGLWVLTEMGVFGLLLFLPLPVAIIAHIHRKWRREPAWNDFALLLVAVAAILFSMAHDMLYQRLLWFILGLLAANRFRLTDTLAKRASSAF